MRITLLNQYYAPDEAPTAQMLSDVGAALAAAGHEVEAICCDRSYADPKKQYPKRERIDGVTIRRVRSTGFGRGNPLGRLTDYATYYLGTSLRLLFGRRRDAIVALTTPPMIALLASVLGHLRGTPTIFWSMDVYPDIAYELGAIRPRSIAGRLLAILSRRTLRSVDCTIALGETMAEHLERGGARRVEVIHNWAEEKLEHELSTTGMITTSPSEELRGTPRNPEELRVLYSGNMGLAHEFDTIIEAASRLPQIDFRFVGGGPRRAEVQRAVNDRALTNVTFSGYVQRDQLVHSLTDTDVHLVTLRERMPGLLVPSKIYGILAAAKPVIYVGPAEGEIYDMLREGNCGVHVPIGDTAGLVHALRTYATDAALIERHGHNARALYDRRFTRVRSIGHFVQLIESLKRVP